MKIKMLVSAIGILLLPVCTSSAFAFGGNFKMGSDGKQSFSKQYKVVSPLDLKVSTTGGNIVTIGQEGNNVDVAFIVESRGKVLDITYEQLKEYADVEVINDNSRLEINVKDVHERNVSISFFVKTPINSSVTLQTSGGNIGVSGITGKQVVNTSGGNIDLENLNGRVIAHTSGGNVSISSSKADFKASTSGGNISLNSIDGKLNVSTSGGNISAENITNGLLASTSGGNIDISKVQGLIQVDTSGGGISLDEVSGTIKATTSGGDIEANILALTGDLELRTSGGAITATVPSKIGLDLDLSADHVNAPPSNFVGSVTKEHVTGQLNGGGILVKLSASSGRIVLNYR